MAGMEHQAPYWPDLLWDTLWRHVRACEKEFSTFPTQICIAVMRTGVYKS